MKTLSKVAIIGAGPAGVAAAVQLQRFGLHPVLFEQTRIGGLLNNAYRVENYPGFPRGISGVNFVKKLEQHLAKWQVKVIHERVLKIVEEKGDFVVHADKMYRMQTVIVASGTKPRLPEIDMNDGHAKILFEVYPIRNIRNKRIVIVGAGDAAFDYALNLRRHNKIMLLNWNKEIKGLDLLFKRMIKSAPGRKDKISYFKNTKVLAIKQLNNCLIAKVVEAGKKGSTIKCDFILFAIGRQPALDYLSPSIRRQFPDGDNKRIYFIGDVRHGDLRQTGIAVGDGIRVAMRIHEYLKTQSRCGDDTEAQK